MSMHDLFNKLHLITLKDALNEKLKEKIDEHIFINDVGFKRVILMWVITKPTYIIDLAYEFFNGVLNLKNLTIVFLIISIFHTRYKRFWNNYTFFCLNCGVLSYYSN